mgnify:FL=1|tara:strand:- start:633 stop:1376 length:744 start_codon:yes stop_codon:yes gene_type:complete
MKKNNPFEVHNIKYLSPSSVNTYISDMPMWVARYLFGVKSGSGAGAVRGIVQESVLADKYRTGKFDFDILEPKFIDTCIEFKLDLEDVKIEKEKKLLKNFAKIIDNNFDYTDLQDYQEKVEVKFEDLPVPYVGYIDFRFINTIVDLKTTTRLPSQPTEAQKRQMAFYSMAYPDNNVELFFASPKDYKKFTLDNLSVYKKQLEKVAFSIQKFLSISSDRYELASLIYPNFDSWTWGYKLQKEAKKIWR